MGPDRATGGGNPEDHYLIVGIGASAGGRSALENFLAPLTEKFSIALVFVERPSSRRENPLPGLLRSRRPDLEIVEITDHLAILPGKIYLCPPGREVRIEKGIFNLIASEKKQVRLPIDGFFSSLAAWAGRRAVAVILSGKGTDGVRGIQAVRNAGGGVFVQDPATAEFAEMPLAAINSGLTDVALSPDEIAREILKIQEGITAAKSPESLITASQFETFCRLIQEKTGYRFYNYKKSVVARRIRRRMYLHGIYSLQEYARLIEVKDEEASHLASDLMIGVTAFFRDRVAWRALRIDVVAKLVEGNDDFPLRIWTPACATGEEAYSIAMMLHHGLALAKRKRHILVFGTDMNDRALERAREGRYPGSISADVPPDFMRRYFSFSADGAEVIINKEIRECVVFAKQDLLTDPPFSRLDAVICRNLLIYLDRDAQEKCLSIFHYALKDGGFLFLGNAESVGSRQALFKTIGHKKCRIYRKIESTPAARLPLAVRLAPVAERPAATHLRHPAASEDGRSVTEAVQEALLEAYAPAAVAVDQDYGVLYLNGPTHRYLHQPRGAPTLNLLELLSKTLQARIQGALHRVRHEGKAVSLRTTIADGSERKRTVTLRLSKIQENLFLIVFREKGVLAEDAGIPPETGAEEGAVRQLENELAATRQELQNRIEQLKSLNEELQASNEELQAANEELETSREELQSLNEELITVNAQIQNSIEEQETTNNDLQNFLTSTSIPTLFLDHQFKVKRFTPAMANFIKLIPADVGRSIEMFQEHLGPGLIADCQAVLDHLAPIRKELTINGAWYIRATLPYRTTDNRIEGVVVTFNEVTEIKLAEERLSRLASFPLLNPHPVIELDSGGRAAYANPAVEKTLEDLGLGKEDVKAFLPGDLDALVGDWDRKGAPCYYREVNVGDRTFGETVHFVPQFEVIRVYAQDITKRKRAEEEIRHNNTLLNGINRIFKEALTCETAEELAKVCLRVAEEITGSRFGFIGEIGPDGLLHDTAISDAGWEACAMYDKAGHRRPPGDFPLRGIYSRVLLDGRSLFANDPSSHPDSIGTAPGHPPLTAFLGVPLTQNDRTVGMIALGNREGGYRRQDVESLEALAPAVVESLHRVRAERALRLSEERLNRAQEISHLGSWELDCIGNVLIWSDEVYRIFGLRPQEFGASYEAFLSSVHPDDRAAVDAAYTNSLNEGRDSYEIEHRIVRKSTGEVRIVREKCEHFRDAAGRIVRSVGMVLDVTDQKRAQDALEHSMRRFELLAETAGELLRAPDPQRVVESLCRKVMEHLDCHVCFNYLADEETGRLHLNAAAGIPEEEMRRIEWLDYGAAVCGCAARDGCAIVAEHIPTTVDERTELVKSYGIKAYACHPLLGPGGSVIGTLSFGTCSRETFGDDDLSLMKAVTDQVATAMIRMRTEQTLRKRSEELEAARLASDYDKRRLETVVDSLPVGVAVLDARGGTIRVNKAFERIWGGPHAETRSVSYYVARKAWWVDTGLPVQPEEWASARAAREKETVVGQMMRIERFDGANAFILNSAAPILDARGQIIGCAVAILDITRRREAEESIIRLNKEIAARNVELEATNKELESFIYSVSHDLRGPLRAIAVFTKTIADSCADSLDDRGKDHLRRVREAAGRMNRLIEDLLYLSRVSRRDIARSRIDLSAMASGIIAALRESSPDRNVKVDIREGLSVFADPQLIELALANLLGNAWKFTSKTADARIAFGALEREGKDVYFVKDNGAGFDPEYAEKMFLPFQRLHDDCEFEGTGIGLAIVEQVVRRHGGKTWAEGNIGKGATFYFTLA